MESVVKQPECNYDRLFTRSIHPKSQGNRILNPDGRLAGYVVWNVKPADSTSVQMIVLAATPGRGILWADTADMR